MVQSDQGVVAIWVGLRREGISRQDQEVVFRFGERIEYDDALRVGEEQNRGRQRVRWVRKGRVVS